MTEYITWVGIKLIINNRPFLLKHCGLEISWIVIIVSGDNNTTIYAKMKLKWHMAEVKIKAIQKY